MRGRIEKNAAVTAIRTMRERSKGGDLHRASKGNTRGSDRGSSAAQHDPEFTGPGLPIGRFIEHQSFTSLSSSREEAVVTKLPVKHRKDSGKGSG